MAIRKSCRWPRPGEGAGQGAAARGRQEAAGLHVADGFRKSLEPLHVQVHLT